MKTRITSLAIALIALFSFNNAFAQNCHQVGELSLSTPGNVLIIDAKVAGLGNALNNTQVNYSVSGTISGYFYCYSKGQTKKDPGTYSPGLTTLSFSGSGSARVKNGNILIHVSEAGPCPNSGFDLEVDPTDSDLIVTIYNSDGSVYCSAPLEL